MARLRILALALLVAAAGLACARGVSLNADPGSYALTVTNEMSHPMIIYVDDGETTRLLGTVAGQREERFVIAGATRPTVTIIANDEPDTHTVRRTVTLNPGYPVDVRIN